MRQIHLSRCARHVNATEKFGILTVSLLDESGASLQKITIKERDATDAELPAITKLTMCKASLCIWSSVCKMGGCSRFGWSEKLAPRQNLYCRPPLKIKPA